MDHYFNSIAKHLDDSGSGDNQAQQQQQQSQPTKQSQTNTTTANNNLISNNIMPNLPGPLPNISSQRRTSSGGGGVRQGSFGNPTNVQVRQTSTGNRQSDSRQSSIGQQQQVNAISINNIQTIQQGQQQQKRSSNTSNPLDAKGEFYYYFILLVFNYIIGGYCIVLYNKHIEYRNCVQLCNCNFLSSTFYTHHLM